MFPRLCILLGLATAAVALPARALQFDFALVFSSGPLAGQTFPGSVVTTDGDGVKAPYDGTMLSFTASVDGTTFTMVDDDAYNTMPRATVAGGGTRLSTLDYYSSDSFASLVLDIVWDESSGTDQVVFTQTGSGSSFGVFKNLNVPTVPEGGSTLGLLALGLGLSALVRRIS